MEETAPAPPNLSAPDKAFPTATSPSTQPDANTGDAAMQRALDKRYGPDAAKKAEILETKKELDAQIDYEERFTEENRRTMIVPPAPDFKPEAVDKKIRLRLFLENTRIRPGDLLKFRLEMTNVGRKQIDYEEYSASIFKFGGLLDSDTIAFYLIGPDGKKVELMPAAAADKIHGDEAATPPTAPNTLVVPGGLSPEGREKWLRDTNARSAASNNFQVRILPGETLRSLGDGDSPYRILYCEQDFTDPGKYRLQVELNDMPPPLSNEDIEHARSYWTPQQTREFHRQSVLKALGPASSNAVSFEVRR